MQQHGCFGVAGVGVTARAGARAPSGVATFSAQQAYRSGQSADIAAVPVDEDQAPGPAGGRPAILHEQHRQGFSADRDRSSETLVFAAGAVGNGGRHQPFLLSNGQVLGVQPRGDGPGHGGRDPGIGI
ncbi:Uncharacterised protein [Mycobacterium tuberculosis]|uniref:Uncharacterized protein n=2 Tax=Mycobacterium tuberculosis TaxID=1773 RepID=A0A654TIW4_MYCTX|nr:Uncharacterised protein [Mycobacterium tuberculosis]CKS60735.1 Uncharacterised protein [Mycobacterium tuberculosis]